MLAPWHLNVARENHTTILPVLILSSWSLAISRLVIHHSSPTTSSYLFTLYTLIFLQTFCLSFPSSLPPCLLFHWNKKRRRRRRSSKSFYSFYTSSHLFFLTWTQLSVFAHGLLVYLSTANFSSYIYKISSSCLLRDFTSAYLLSLYCRINFFLYEDYSHQQQTCTKFF